MAVKWPLANGNWSNAANWNDGTLPDVGDDVHADGKTITIDVDTITVNSIRTNLRSGGTNGGRFNLGSGIPTFNITANIFTGSVGSVITLNIGVSCTLNLTGNLFGAVGAGLGSWAVFISVSNVTLNITGTLTAGTGQQTHVVGLTSNFLSGLIINLIGDINATNSGIQVVCLGSTGLNGNITNSNISMLGTLNSRVQAVNAPLPINLVLSSNNNVNMTGIINQETNNGFAVWLYLSNDNNVINLDECRVLDASFGAAVRLLANTISLNPGGVVNIKKIIHPLDFKNIISINDVRCSYIVEEIVLPSNLKLKSNDFYIETIDSLNNTVVLTENSDITDRLPVTSDVRNNITYNGNLLTGTLAVPSPSNVRKDIPTDNTVGTADLTGDDILNAIAASTLPLAVRLKNVATVQSTGDQITSI